MPGHARAVEGGGGGDKRSATTNYVSHLSFKRSEIGLRDTGDLPVRLARCSVVIIRFVEELLFQMLIEQMVKQIQYVIDWLSAFPWQVWFA
jgi:hypothetical protein